MAHQTGSATSPIDLLNTLRLFCIAQSIQVNEYINDGTYQILSIQFGTGFYSIGYDDRTPTSSNTGESYIITQSTAWNSSTAFGSQPNQTGITRTSATLSNVVTGSVPVYHFFYFPNGMLYVALQLSAGNWTSFGVGDITKFGTYTGGSCTLGNYIDFGSTISETPFSQNHAFFGCFSETGSTNQTRGNKVRVDHNGTNKFYTINSRTGTANRGYSNIYPFRANITSATAAAINVVPWTTPSAATQATTLYPFYFYVNQGTNVNKGIPVGELPDARFVNMRFFNSGDIFDNDWRIFSLGRKKDWFVRDGDMNTGYFGIALRFQ